MNHSENQSSANSAEPCSDCVQATLTSWHGFTARCLGCAARAVARGVNYSAARKQGAQTRLYRAELELYGVTHEQVREAAKVDQLEEARG